MDLLSLAQLLGSFGEFFAAVAVFVTLGYLALQVRQAKRTLIRQNERNLTAEVVAISMKMAELPHLPKIFTKGVANWQDLDQEEALALHMWLWSFLSPLEHATIDKRTGLFESDILNVYAEGMVNVLRAPGGAAWYENNRSLFTKGVQDYISTMLPKGQRTTFDVFNIDDPGESR